MRVPSHTQSHSVLSCCTRRHYTGGLILAGYHEVVCTPGTLAALSARLGNPATAMRPQIRISSTFFWHLSSDETLSPRSFRERTSGNEVVQRERRRVEDAGGKWDVEKYEEGMKVGTLVQVRLLLLLAVCQDTARRTNVSFPHRTSSSTLRCSPIRELR